MQNQSSNTPGITTQNFSVAARPELPIRLNTDHTLELIDLLHVNPEHLKREQIGGLEYITGTIDNPNAPGRVELALCWDGYAESESLLIAWRPESLH